MASKRPKGWAEWNPKPETLELIGQVTNVLEEYSDHLPLTARQVFYRLVGAYGYDKTEKAYSRLCEHLVRARRAGMIRFQDIRDDGTAEHLAGSGWNSPAAFWDSLFEAGDDYERPTREGQDFRIELWSEAGGMAPTLARVARPYGVPVYSTGGFSSVTVTFEIAQRARRSRLPTIFLHVGDYDPSGESIFNAMAEDAMAFLPFSTEFTPVRVALTEAQVEEHGLETAPPKASDSRSVNWIGETCQAEAIPPDLLARLVEDAIEEYTDMAQLREVEERGAEERAEIVEKLEELRGQSEE